MSLASLPMYALPGVRADWARLWDYLAPALRGAGFDAPSALARPVDLARHWRDPRLLLSQSCFRPMSRGLAAHVHVVGAFDHGLAGAAAGQYYSVLVRRRGDPLPPDPAAWGRIAINGTDSHSGFGVLEHLELEPAIITGSHLASLAAVRAGHADLCAIDAVTWRFARRIPGATSGLAVVGQSASAPALPLITARRHDPGRLFQAVLSGFLDAPEPLKRRLGLRGLVRSRQEIYGPQ